jgi:predicted RNase H-like HicB family nuclease
MRIGITLQVHLPVAVKQEGRWFISSCPVLDVHSQGPTQKKAVQNIIEALQLFFVRCYEHGTLNRVLRKAGFRPAARQGTELRTKLRKLPPEYEMLDVPISLVVERRREDVCPA